MCTRLKQGESILTPNMIIQYKTLTSPEYREGLFGISRGKLVNARSDKLRTIWVKLFTEGRAIVEVDSFFEKGIEFRSTGGSLYLAALYNDREEVAIVTREPVDIVAGIHHRMPMILPDEQYKDWLSIGSQWIGDYSPQQLVRV